MTSYDMDKMSSPGKEIMVSDRRHSALAVREEPSVVDDSITYQMALSRDRYSLFEDLFNLTSAVFRKIPRNRIHLLDEEDFLLDSIYLLKTSDNASLYVHREAIQNHLNKLPALLEEIVTYSVGGKRIHQELLITWGLRGFTRKLKTLLKRPVTKAQLDNASGSTDGLAITLSGEFAQLYLDRSNPVASRGAAIRQKEEAKKASEVEQEQATLKSWLSKISPDLLTAYLTTEDIFSEAEALASSAEDEYFLEQVNADYYPHIFEALGKYEGENADFAAKELTVVETLKQFKIIQLGLQKIIDNTVTKNLDAVKSQTEFLRNKVLGEQYFSLMTPKEADVEIENSVEESNRIREELYKKHVAPQLEKNRTEYENTISELKTAHKTELYRIHKRHNQELAKQKAELQRTYGSEVSKYKNLAYEYKQRYLDTAKSSEAYHYTKMDELRQKHSNDIKTLKKEYDRSAHIAQRTHDNFLQLQDEIVRLQTLLAKEQASNLNKVAVKLESSADLYKAPKNYRQATQDEVDELYEIYDINDGSWFDEEYF